MTTQWIHYFSEWTVCVADVEQFEG